MKELNFGFVLIDKPKNIKSREISKTISKILKTKAAHLGTLDPDATGILPILLGRTTILTHFIMRQDKEYIVTIKFDEKVNIKKLNKVLQKFVGEIEQIPPEISAVAKRKRRRKIYELELLEIKDNIIKIRVFCEAGTYMSVLAKDIGKKLKNKAEMIDLRRTKLGKFTIENTIPFEKFLKSVEEKNFSAFIRPIEEIVPFKRIWVNEGAVEAMRLGISLKIPGIKRFEKFNKGDYVSILTEEGKLISIGIALMDSDEILKKEKGEVVKIDRVLRTAGLAEW
jgi:H/ACA ribonucleoprotein complex subunit 4